jgi:hypothetical protein
MTRPAPDTQQTDQQQPTVGDETTPFSKLFMVQAQLALYVYFLTLSAMFSFYPSFGINVFKTLKAQMQDGIQQAYKHLGDAKNFEAVFTVHSQLIRAQLNAIEQFFTAWVKSMGKASQ